MYKALIALLRAASPKAQQMAAETLRIVQVKIVVLYFVYTPCTIFIIAKLFFLVMFKDIIGASRNPGLRISSFAKIKILDNQCKKLLTSIFPQY